MKPTEDAGPPTENTQTTATTTTNGGTPPGHRISTSQPSRHASATITASGPRITGRRASSGPMIRLATRPPITSIISRALAVAGLYPRPWVRYGNPHSTANAVGPAIVDRCTQNASRPAGNRHAFLTSPSTCRPAGVLGAPVD